MKNRKTSLVPIYPKCLAKRSIKLHLAAHCGNNEFLIVEDILVPLDGIELSTFALRMRCSTD